MENKVELPTARQMIPALTDALAALGGAATVKELEDSVARSLGLSAQQLAVPHDKSRTEFQYRFAWTRSYAKKQGLVTSPARNKWAIANS